MKCNENKFADVTLLKLHPIVNVFMVRVRTIILQTQGVEITLVQHRFFNVLTLKLFYRLESLLTMPNVRQGRTSSIKEIMSF